MLYSLVPAHEGSTQVNEFKISMLTIDQKFRRFQIITSGMRSLGKTYNNMYQVKKILRSAKQWRFKVTAIQEVKNFTTLLTKELIGSPKIHQNS